MWRYRPLLTLFVVTSRSISSKIINLSKIHDPRNIIYFWIASETKETRWTGKKIESVFLPQDHPCQKSGFTGMKEQWRSQKYTESRTCWERRNFLFFLVHKYYFLSGVKIYVSVDANTCPNSFGLALK